MANNFNDQLDPTEELDFHYLLELMLPLHNELEYAWLPELFSIVGHERLIKLCKYAGGETIKIPTIAELSNSLEALRWFYRVVVDKSKDITEVPPKYCSLVTKIMEIYHARQDS